MSNVFPWTYNNLRKIQNGDQGRSHGNPKLEMQKQILGHSDKKEKLKYRSLKEKKKSYGEVWLTITLTILGLSYPDSLPHNTGHSCV